MLRVKVIYHETELTPLLDTEEIAKLPTTNITMEEVQDNCEAFHLEVTFTFTEE